MMINLMQIQLIVDSNGIHSVLIGSCILKSAAGIRCRSKQHINIVAAPYFFVPVGRFTVLPMRRQVGISEEQSDPSTY